MKTVKGKVLIFKAPTDYTDGDDDPDTAKLEEAGLHTQNVPVLDFEYCNLNVLEQNIKNPRMFSVTEMVCCKTSVIVRILHDSELIQTLEKKIRLVFTSPRAIRAVACIKDARSLLGGWQNHPVFVVGEGTSNILKKVLHLNGKGSSAGNASALADEILESKYEHPLLFPCGNLKRDELSTKLSGKGVSVIAVTVYQTQVHPQLEQRLNEIILQNSGFPEIVVYFSPSGLKYTIPILEKMEVPLHQLKLVAIGPTTAEAALSEYKLKVWSVASKPTSEHLLEAVLKL